MVSASAVAGKRELSGCSACARALLVLISLARASFQMIDWSFLGRAEPIDMRDAATAFVADSPQEMAMVKR
jgi:hypothetical protein